MSIRKFFTLDPWKRIFVGFLIAAEIGLSAIITPLEKIEEYKNKKLAEKDKKEKKNGNTF